MRDRQTEIDRDTITDGQRQTGSRTDRFHHSLDLLPSYAKLVPRLRVARCRRTTAYRSTHTGALTAILLFGGRSQVATQDFR